MKARDQSMGFDDIYSGVCSTAGIGVVESVRCSVI
jgi:hypothetical protein